MKTPRRAHVPYHSRLNLHTVEQQLRERRVQVVSDIAIEKANLYVELPQIQEALGLSDIINTRIAKHMMKNTSEKVIMLDKKLHVWDQKMNMLLRSCTSKPVSGTLAVLNRMLCPSSVELLFLDMDICTRCNEMLVFCTVTYTNTCPKCSGVTHVLVASEDLLSDVLIYRIQYPVGSAIEMEDRFGDQQIVTPTTTCTAYPTTKILAYNRYLEQFSETFPTIPTDVMNCLYRSLSVIHSTTPHRCRPTPVANILRINGYIAWCHAATRISFHFNGQHIPVLTTLIIERLSKRFKVLFRASTLPQYVTKLPSFEILTHCMLRLDGHHVLARSFQLNKTGVALHAVNERIQHLISIACKIDTEYSWIGCERLF
jgi:hypothetical protein